MDKATRQLVMVGYTMAVVMPVIGLLIGLTLAVRADKSDRKAGTNIVMLSIGAFVLWYDIIVARGGA